MKYITKIQMYLIKDANKRTKKLVKKNYFKSVRNNFFFQPRLIPDEQKLISFGNNVVGARNPIKVITTFDNYIEKRKKENSTLVYPSTDNEINYLWDKFANEKNNK